MAQTTPNLGLTVWNLKSDLYDSGQLARNFIAIDQHDHSGNGKGSPIDATNAILNGSITGAKLATPAVGTGNLADGSVTSTKLADNSVTTNAITNLNVTGNKIADGTITRAKLNSDVNIPIVYHRNANGSLPSSTVNGSSLYDGYTIDYGFNVDHTSDAWFAKTDADYRSFIWRLRYNSSKTAWDFIGGTPLSPSRISDVTSDGTLAESFYGGWGAAPFLSFALPLKGYYQVSSYAVVQSSGSTSATVKSALFLGATSSGTIVTPLSNSGAYTSANGNEFSTLNILPFNVATSSNTSSANVVSNVFGWANKPTGSPTLKIANQQLIITPYLSLTNY
jgi:hypothetical protein